MNLILAAMPSHICMTHSLVGTRDLSVSSANR